MENLTSNFSGLNFNEEKYSEPRNNKKCPPLVPSKQPNGKTQPQVPRSCNVKQICEPLFSQELNSKNVYANMKAENTYANVPMSASNHYQNKSDQQGSTGWSLYSNREDLPPDELPQPPSPVSSSYSELRRTHNDGSESTSGEILPYGDVYAMQNKQAIYNNVQPNMMYKMPNSQYYTTYNQNYESIYEPINPRPSSSQLSCHSNYSLYTPYINCPPNYNYKTPVKQETEVDALTNLLVQSMNSNQQNLDQDSETFGVCVKCGNGVIGENSGCTAMGKIYHITCFTCVQCQINLQGKPFYALDGKPYCEDDYLNTLEKCSVCLKPILERILRATGKPYHPQCFCCIVCGKSLDGIPFTVDATNQIHCIDDFHKKFAPRCCVCRLPIMPEPGSEEALRVVALDRSFHIKCYKCEDCGMLLSIEAEGRGCYPLDDHILCKSCNVVRIQALTSRMITEL